MKRSRKDLAAGCGSSGDVQGRASRSQWKAGKRPVLTNQLQH